MKPSVTGNKPISVTATGTVSTSGREIVGIHYLNTTAGVGRIDIQVGTTNEVITMGAAAANGTDHISLPQVIKADKIIVTFTTGTGVVTLFTN